MSNPTIPTESAAHDEVPDRTIHYTLPATQLEEGMSTGDGQDITEVSTAPDGWITATVYTPRSDDPELDAANQREPEHRLYSATERVDLAVFPDTDVDGSEDPDAEVTRIIDPRTNHERHGVAITVEGDVHE